MDAQEFYGVVDGAVPCAVVGRGEDFMLIRMDVSPDDLAAAIAAGHADAKAKGQEYLFAGVMATVDGQAVCKCQPGLDAMRVMMHAAVPSRRCQA